MRHRKQKVKPWTLIQQVTTNNTKHEWNKQSSQMAESARRARKTWVGSTRVTQSLHGLPFFSTTEASENRL